MATEKSIELSNMAAQYVSGNKSVEEKFFTELYNYVSYNCSKIVNQNYLEDAVQESMKLILQILPQYDISKAQFTTYIRFKIIDACNYINDLHIPKNYVSKNAAIVLANPDYQNWIYQPGNKTKEDIYNKVRELYPEFKDVQIRHIIDYLYDHLYNEKKIVTYENGGLPPEPATQSTEELYEEMEIHRRVQKLLSYMNPKIRIAVMRYYGIGYKKESLEVIAQDMHLSRSTLAQRINREFALIKDMEEFEILINKINR